MSKITDPRSEFRRSHKGNLWRKMDGNLLVVFERRDSQFAWVISRDGCGPRFSKRHFASEDEALDDLLDAMEQL